MYLSKHTIGATILSLALCSAPACSQPEVRDQQEPLTKEASGSAEQPERTQSDDGERDQASGEGPVSLAESPLQRDLGDDARPDRRSAWQKGSPKMEPIADDPADNPRTYWGPTYVFLDDGRYVFSDQSCTRDVRASVGTWSFHDGQLTLREERRIEDVGGEVVFGPDRWCHLESAEREVRHHAEPVVERIAVEECTEVELKAHTAKDREESRCLSFDGQPYWIPTRYRVEDVWPKQWQAWFQQVDQGYPTMRAGAWARGTPYLNNGYGTVHRLYEDGRYVFRAIDCKRGNRASVGTWSYEMGELILKEERRLYHEGGAPHPTQCKVEGARKVIDVHDEPVTKKLSVEACPDELLAHQPDFYAGFDDCRFIDRKQTWRVDDKASMDWDKDWREWFEVE